MLLFLQNSSSVALLHKHLQLLLPHATDIFSRSVVLIKESSWNGSIREKLQGNGSFAGRRRSPVVSAATLRRCQHFLVGLVLKRLVGSVSHFILKGFHPS